MRKQFVSKVLTITLAASLAAMSLVGCGSASSEDGSALDEAVIEESLNSELITEEPVAMAPSADSEDEEGAPIFKKGVYVNYAKEAENPTKNYFYVFNDEGWGHTEDSENGAGVPFDCVQDEGSVHFSFGSVDAIEDVFVVTSVEDGVIYGHFDDDMKIELVFEPVPDVDPDTFNAVNYMSTGDYIYENANGWSIKYDPKRFDITEDANKVAIVYNGEGVGTNMIMVTYDVDMTAKEKRDAIAKEYGENATTMETPFPGADDVTAYRASCPAGEGGSGLYEEAIIIEYMGGYLCFEVIGHLTGNDELDMEVCDYLAGILDSLTFMSYGD
ncbi:hypothetical protein [Butyrivibrio sp. VCB2006]|uniref:hypothetical protein n=1 Tax=Butyrivibrio sp. VCB2006 TaxID=1280679 RepID=UPI00040E2A20|nr:hypothetical protein [Butyrivibrio sp. VCB2006]